MNQIFLQLNSDKLTKLKETSEYFKGLKSYSQSDYWRYHESLSDHKFCSNGILIKGWSGHYYPRRKTRYNQFRAALARRIRTTTFKFCYDKLLLGITNPL